MTEAVGIPPPKKNKKSKKTLATPCGIVHFHVSFLSGGLLRLVGITIQSPATTTQVKLMSTMKSASKYFAVALAGSLLFAASAGAQVLDSAIDYAVEGDGTSSTLSLGNFTVANNSNRILVLTASSRQIDDFTSVTYGSQSFTLAEGQFSTSRDYGIFYLLNPDVGTNAITFTTGSNVAADKGFAGGVVSLYNAEQSAPIASSYSEPDGSTFRLSYDLGATAQNFFFVEGSVANNGGGRLITSTPSGFNTLLNEDAPEGMEMTAFSGYQDGGSLSGTINRDFGVGNNSQRVAAGLAIAAIPEPSSFALLAGALGLGLVVARRRRS